MRRKTIIAAAAALALAPLAACGNGAEADTGGTVTVFAAASLTEAFTEIGAQFEAEHDGVKVEFNFAGSSDLAAQITEGAPADVFASADESNMDKVVEAGAAAEPETFALNQLVIAVPEGNPDGVTGLGDLAGLDFAACATEVPCGSAAQTALDGTGLTPVTYEADVKSTLQRLLLGEVDAALVYRTDAIAAGTDVDGIEFPESAAALNTYPIAALEDAPNPELAAAFAAHVLSDDAQSVLETAGFQRP
ncbi:molybdate ABC transporter substrate-binding protein [Glycomyces niveus]|uniref:Molybdate ABC transporter substrate-binding protein n=1 Tax=Glycomyces niveus TaxID=2820287 RepID=A0ABS3U7E9_9ACTN|nr:molybdate ABC transporter substrate-binding protein [Glycomyces sp. NEAU-S30]MBO3734663.1 molybdate ABC transporter substrate-binding protein [Glycomyces sp. NEAU-S30]